MTKFKFNLEDAMQSANNTLNIEDYNTAKVIGNPINQFKFDTSILDNRDCLVTQNDLHVYALVDVCYSIDGGATKYLLKTQNLCSNHEKFSTIFTQSLIALAFRKLDYDLEGNSQSKIDKIDSYIKAISIKVASGEVGLLGRSVAPSNAQLAALNGYTLKQYNKLYGDTTDTLSDKVTLDEFQGDFTKTMYGFLNLEATVNDITNKFFNLPISFNEDKINSLSVVHQAIYMFAHKVYELGRDWDFFTSKFQLSLANLRSVKGDTKSVINVEDF